MTNIYITVIVHTPNANSAKRRDIIIVGGMGGDGKNGICVCAGTQGEAGGECVKSSSSLVGSRWMMSAMEQFIHT